MSEVMSEVMSDVTFDTHSNFWSMSESDKSGVCKTDDLKLDEYKILKFLGSGSFGSAYLANRVNTSKQYVLKFIQIKNPNSKSVGVKLEDIHSEINILRKISNNGCTPDILCYHDHFFTCKDNIVKMVIVTEAFTNSISLTKFIETNVLNISNKLDNEISSLMDQRDDIEDNLRYLSNSIDAQSLQQLQQKLNKIELKIKIKSEKLEENQITPLSHNILLKIMYNVLKAMYHLFKVGIGHGDLKPANILINEKTYAIQIIDFGLACTKDCLPLGTILYDSPEILKNHLKGRIERTFSLNRLQKSDIFTIGLIFYELANGKLPLLPKQLPIKELFDFYNTGTIFSMYNENKYPIDEKINTFIDSILKIDPDVRPEIKKLITNLEEIIQEYNVLVEKHKSKRERIEIDHQSPVNYSPVKYSPVVFTPNTPNTSNEINTPNEINTLSQKGSGFNKKTSKYPRKWSKE